MLKNSKPEWLEVENSYFSGLEFSPQTLLKILFFTVFLGSCFHQEEENFRNDENLDASELDNDASELDNDGSLNANGAEPCISVTHEEGYDFGQRLIGQISEEIFTITNCSDAVEGQPLIIDGINWVEEHDWFEIIPTAGDLSLDILSLDVDSLMADGTVEIEPQSSRNFTVTFAPTEEAIAEASFEILSNDEIKNPLDIHLRGLGSNNQCPVAVATCTIRGTTAGSSELNAIPLDFLDCDASQSYDADGAIASYNWEVIARPEGSTASFTPNGSVVNPSFFVDLSGRYVFRLNVFDEENTPSCEPADVIIMATSPESIYVQLVWDTPADADQTDDIGSDLDLHFAHSNGDWNDSSWDVYFANTTSAEPGNIHLYEPEDGTQYRVGLHYYDDTGFGNSYATVRIYINGTQVFEIADKLMTNGNSSIQDMWDVASIDWPSQTITRIDRISQVDYR